MRDRVISVVAVLWAAVFLGTFPLSAKAVPVGFNFKFEVPDFTEVELLPLEQLFVDDGVTGVSGSVFWDTDDADFVTSNFTLMSNMDSLFDQTPDELVFSPGGNLNQIRSWEVELSGTRFILQLTGLDETDVLPNMWFGGAILTPDDDNVFELTAAGGGLTPASVPEPAMLWLFGAGLFVISFSRGFNRVLKIT